MQADPEIFTLRNLNTQGDYERALAVFAEHAGRSLP
jgi:hypothetical protein